METVKVAQRMSIECIKEALRKYTTDEKERKWFESKNAEPFSYKWCLEHSKVNPNLVNECISWLKDGNELKDFKDFKNGVISA